jgi:hypothetical protein
MLSLFMSCILITCIYQEHGFQLYDWWRTVQTLLLLTVKTSRAVPTRDLQSSIACIMCYVAYQLARNVLGVSHYSVLWTPSTMDSSRGLGCEHLWTIVPNQASVVGHSAKSLATVISSWNLVAFFKVLWSKTLTGRKHCDARWFGHNRQSLQNSNTPRIRR